ncbi:hypothetical protein [Porticoccus sp.]
MNLDLLFQAIVTLIGAAAAYFALRTKVSKDAQVEADRLLKLRNLRIEHMEEEIAELKRQLNELRAHMSYIEEYNIKQLAAQLADILVDKTPSIEVVAERVENNGS